MAESPNRSQLMEGARRLILDGESKFSLKALCAELGCSRSDVRRHFSTKADLVSAVFGADVPHGHVSPPRAAGLVGELTSNKGSSNDDWIARRFRIFERAIATLETNIEDVRSECAQSITQLRQRITVSKDTSDHARVTTEVLGDEPPCDDLSEAAPQQTRRAGADFEAVDFGRNHAGTRPSGDLPPVIRSVHTAASEPSAQSSDSLPFDEDGLLFVTAPEAAHRGDSWRDLIILGLTAFSAALMVAGLVLTLTSRAGATNTFGSEKRATPTQLSVASKLPKNEGKETARPPVVIDATEVAIHPLSTADRTGADEGEGVLRNMVTLNSAGSVDTRAKVRLALAYLRGEGVKTDMLMGAFWSAAAAQQGDADAQFVLGSLYAEGIKPNPQQAYRWLASAASLNNPKAMHNVAIALLSGVGVAKDKTAAINWFRRAADLGYRDSAFDLGVLYERGDGVQQNSRTALWWYDKAASMGDQQAAERAALLRSDGLQVASGN